MSTWVCADCEYENPNSAQNCEACDAARPEEKSSKGKNDDDEEDELKGFVCGRVLEIEEIAGGKARKLLIDCGEEGAPPRTIVTTAAPNVQTANVMVIVALAGVAKVNDEPVKTATVCGVPSQGMLCDSAMLKWSGGGAGLAALASPDSKPGDRAPKTRPRMK